MQIALNINMVYDIPPQNKHAIDAVDRTIREIMGRDTPFGGIMLSCDSTWKMIDGKYPELKSG